MLKKSNRIRKNKDFGRIFREGKRINTDYFSIKITKNNSDESRFGFVVSKKVSNKSTARNRIKRLLSEVARKKISEIKKGVDVVIIVKKDFSGEKFAELDEFIESILKKESLLVKTSNFKN